MSERKGSSGLTLILLVGLTASMSIIAFIIGNSLIARADQAFGPAASNLNPVQRWPLGIGLGWRSQALLRPLNETGNSQAFSIELNESTDSILNRLEGEGLIREAELFGDYLIYSGLDRQLQAGDFELSPAMNAVEIAAALLDPNPSQATFTIFAGWRLEEIIASLPSTGLEISAEDFWDATHKAYPDIDFLAEHAESSSLEGYFLPGTYLFERETRANDVVRNLLEALEKQLSEDMFLGFANQGLSFEQALTLASIVERESVIEEEMPLIASVFLNRLEAEIKLEADPTVQYAVGFDQESDSWWTNSISSQDLAIDSPYNTYIYEGLPPSPIASPSLSALSAVAFPENSAYYFFQAACDGSGLHVFALTFEEHVGNNCP